MQFDDHNFYQEYLQRGQISSFAMPLVIWWNRRMIRLAQKLGFNKSGKLLEVGYGFGLFATEAEKNFYEYTAVDGSVALFEQGVKNNHNVILGFVPPMPESLSCNSFDCAWMSEVLEHARDWGHAREILKEVYLSLRVGGTLAVISPVISSRERDFWDTDWSHGFPTTVNRVNQLLYEVGFSKVNSKTHTLTISSKSLRMLVDIGFKVLPWRLIDLIFIYFFKKPFARSFMHLMGFRQIICIATK